MSSKRPISEVLQPVFKLVMSFKKIADKVLGAELSITTSQFRMLIAIKHNPNLSQREIAEFWNVTEASASRQIEILNRKGLVSKEQASDNHRKHVLKLTKSGEKEIKKALSIMSGVFERIFQDVSEKDKETFHNLLQRFIAIIKEEELALKTDNIKKYKDK